MNGGYDSEALMQQYRDWQNQQWQPPDWGQPPPVTVDKSQYPSYYPYPNLQQAPMSAVAHGWGLPPEAAVGGGELSPWAEPRIQPTGTIGGQTSRTLRSYDPIQQAPVPETPWGPSFTPRWESTPEAWKTPPSFLEQVIGESGPFTPEAREYFQQLKMRIKEPGQLTGGGGWAPWSDTIELDTSQPEGMIHELTHAWWEEKRQDRDLRQAFVEAVIRYADESQQFEIKPPLGQLAHIYVYGDPNDPGFSEGMKTTAEGSKGYTGTESFSIDGNYWNDWEMYAGLASGSKGDIRQLPPYLQQFYEGLFNVLPPEAPGYAFPEPKRQGSIGENIPATGRGPVLTGWGHTSIPDYEFPAGGWGYYGVPPPDIQGLTNASSWGMRPPALY